jgi:hypothetical protein
MADDDLLKEAKDAFQEVEECEHDNRSDALDDLRFARLGEQWPANIVKQRQSEGRPCLTINRMPAFIRQVVNDSRQNKPSIKVHPVDSGADKETADVLNGLIRNIEYSSSADVAYDTATECAIGMGFGYFRIGLDYAHADTFDMDISIDRVSNPFSVYRDPMSTAADSSDWNSAFVVEMMAKKEFEKKYKGAAKVDWDSGAYQGLADPWATEDTVLVAEWWKREEYEKTIYLLSDGTVLSEDRLKALLPLLQAQGIEVKGSRKSKCYKVKQCKLTGAEVLDDSYDWPGQFIPIVPVYGDEVDVEGKRYFRSMIRDAKDAQRMFNYWRTTTTELVALAPKTPFIGKKGAFKTDAAKWATANTQSHSYIEHDGDIPPQRQPFVGVPAGAMQEALNASDDMKAIMGLYDASLGARSNETSGRAIMARQREGDVSTFHFQDNMARAIRHAGRILIDLIPFVYDKARIVRVIGEDGTPDSAKINQPTEVIDPVTKQPAMQQGENGEPVPMTRIYDLTAGKYDVTVTTGPSFTTRREEAATQMTEMVRAFPDAAPVIGDLIAKNLDWPGADEIAERLKAINPVLNQQNQGPSPEQVKLQIDQQRAAMEAQGKQADMQFKEREAALKERQMQAEFAHETRMMQLKEREAMLRMSEAREKSAMDINHRQQTHAQSLAERRERAEANGAAGAA